MKITSLQRRVPGQKGFGRRRRDYDEGNVRERGSELDMVGLRGKRASEPEPDSSKAHTHTHTHDSCNLDYSTAQHSAEGCGFLW
jgi:hypothetical protein